MCLEISRGFLFESWQYWSNLCALTTVCSYIFFSFFHFHRQSFFRDMNIYFRRFSMEKKSLTNAGLTSDNYSQTQMYNTMRISSFLPASPDAEYKNVYSFMHIPHTSWWRCVQANKISPFYRNSSVAPFNYASLQNSLSCRVRGFRFHI